MKKAKKPVWLYLAGLILVALIITLASISTNRETAVTNNTSFLARILPVAERPMNIVLIMTDDQRFDTLDHMQKVKEKLVKKGVHFTNTFVTTPLCCPDRVSLLSGGYAAQNTGVLTNDFPNGGAPRFLDHDKKALPVLLQNKGYRTGIFGKYLNLYNELAASSSPYLKEDKTPYIPPGWNEFKVTSANNEPKDWYNFDFVQGKSTAEPGIGTRGTLRGMYITEFFSAAATEFIRTSVTARQPFFLYFPTQGPHAPAICEQVFCNKFLNFTYKNRAFMEEDLSDKPAWVKWKTDKYKIQSTIQETVQNQLKSLQSIDTAVDNIMLTIESMGELDNTIFIFTSDNGYLWGEHQLNDKSAPYEEALRVPLVIRHPNGRQNEKDDRYIYSNLDIGATIQDIAKLEKKTDGTSLLPAIHDASAKPQRSETFHEFYSNRVTWPIPSWVALRWFMKDTQKEYKYVEYMSGEKEFYDLSADPYEKENLFYATTTLEKRSDVLTVKKIMTNMATNLGKKSRGLAIATHTTTNNQGTLPLPTIGTEYSHTFRAWGGQKPYTWSWNIVNCQGCKTSLPQGLKLNSETGELSGTPLTTDAGFYRFVVKVQSERKRKFTNTKEDFPEQFQFTIKPKTATPN